MDDESSSDLQVVSDDELPSLKVSKVPTKWKPNKADNVYSPGSSTPEWEPANKKQAFTKNGESRGKTTPAEKLNMELLPEPDKYWKVVYDEPTDSNCWTYWLQYDQEVMTEDELPSLKKDLKEPGKWKPNEAGDDGPGPSTSESEPANKRQAVAKNGESKPIPAEKQSSSEENPNKEPLPEPNNYLEVLYDEPTDSTGWTYCLVDEYVVQESDVEVPVEPGRKANVHGSKYADHEKRKGRRKKCLESDVEVPVEPGRKANVHGSKYADHEKRKRRRKKCLESDVEVPVEPVREAKGYGCKYADHEKRKGRRKKCLENEETPLLAEDIAVDSGSEDDDEEFNEEQLRESLEAEEQLEEVEASSNNEEFIWSPDYSSFRGVREEFREEVGSKIKGLNPLDVFIQLWDQPLMAHIVTETNNYAWQKIVEATEAGDITNKSRLHLWEETSMDELYRLIAVFIFMSICTRNRIDEYWTTGILGMPDFRKLMSENRFLSLLSFLHFADNYSIEGHGSQKKIAKIKPILDYLNHKFQSVYTPRQELSLDESLLLWKGRLSWVQCIRTKAARFGIKTYELCESITGYVLNMVIYTGKDTTCMAAVSGFTSSTAKVVINLVSNYLDKGYTLFMDNFYNSVRLCRFLKTKRTDVVGTLNRRRVDTPADICNIQEKVPRGTVVSRHCGDVSVLSWKDVKLVTTVSTYHRDNLIAKKAGNVRQKPEVIDAYNKYMGGVDLKDHKLSMYLMERKRGGKWYIKVFRRLLNITILNSYIIYCDNIDRLKTKNKKLSHRQFRLRLAEGIVHRFGIDIKVVHKSNNAELRLDATVQHFPEHVPIEGERTSKQDRYKRGRCARCAFQTHRKVTNVFCSSCKTFLCLGQCWRDFHTIEEL